MDVGKVAVADDFCIGVLFLQAAEQLQQGTFLHGRTGVGRNTVLVKTTFVTDSERVLVIALGVCTNQVLVTCLIGLAIAGDVVVIARESESFRVTADESCHGKVLVAARGRTVNHYQINVPHDCTKNELIIAVSTVMMNWMMVFHFFMSLKIFIMLSLSLVLRVVY